MNPIALFALWQALMAAYAACFTRPSFNVFQVWATGLALTAENHTITSCVTDADRQHAWRRLEYFAEQAAWDPRQVEAVTSQLIQDRVVVPQLHGYNVLAVDDSKILRRSSDVWGTCTFAYRTPRDPNTARRIRAHNVVTVGRIVSSLQVPAPNASTSPPSTLSPSPVAGPPSARDADRTPIFFPISGSFYFRRTQLPKIQVGSQPPVYVDVEFRTKPQLALELAKSHARTVSGPTLAVMDGGYCGGNLLRALVDCDPPQNANTNTNTNTNSSDPQATNPRIEYITRLRHDAALHRLPTPVVGPRKQGRSRKYGERLSPPRQGGRWPCQWQYGQAWIYGRVRTLRWKELVCLWPGGTRDVPVKVAVAEVQGIQSRITPITSDLKLTGLQMVELFAARYQQEEGYRDLKQEMGWDEGRMWTQNPIIRTSTMQFTVQTLLKLMQLRLDQECRDMAAQNQNHQGNDQTAEPSTPTSVSTEIPTPTPPPLISPSTATTSATQTAVPTVASASTPSSPQAPPLAPMVTRPATTTPAPIPLPAATPSLTSTPTSTAVPATASTTPTTPTLEPPQSRASATMATSGPNPDLALANGQAESPTIPGQSSTPPPTLVRPPAANSTPTTSSSGPRSQDHPQNPIPIPNPVTWWNPPPWYPNKPHPTIRDVQRLMRQHAQVFRTSLPPL